MSDVVSIEQIKSAIRHGAIWDGFSGPTGVTKDEALGYAVELCDAFEAIQAERDRLRGLLLVQVTNADSSAVDATNRAFVAEAKLQAVSDVHQPELLASRHLHTCRADRQVWPCPTVRIMQGDES